ncbi:MAG: hypothetical protein ACTSVU_07380 [Promethearchaeota archaeon]
MWMNILSVSSVLFGNLLKFLGVVLALFLIGLLCAKGNAIYTKIIKRFSQPVSSPKTDGNSK